MATLLNRPEPLSGETVPVTDKSPWECLLEIRDELAGTPLFVWESPGGAEIAGVGIARRIEASGPDRFAQARAAIDATFRDAPSTAIALGGFSFGEQDLGRAWPGFPDAFFVVPERTFSRSPEGTLETRWKPARFEAGLPPARTEPEGAPGDRASWTDAVRRTLDRIREGAFSKAVLARSMVIPIGRAVDALDLLAALRETYPTCHRFLVDDGRGRAFLGASPERLVRLEPGRYFTEAVAGTQRCQAGDDAEAMGRALLERAKDRREHEAVLRHVLDTVTPLSAGVPEVGATEVVRLPHLLHLRTRVSGSARPRHVLDFVSRLHPTPAIAGWPVAPALDWIRRVEAGERGWYAGCVGWVNGSGDGDFAVGIRSIAIRDEEARVFAGAGIVEGSDPEQEWNETELKMKGTLDAIARD